MLKWVRCILWDCILSIASGIINVLNLKFYFIKNYLKLFMIVVNGEQPKCLCDYVDSKCWLGARKMKNYLQSHASTMLSWSCELTCDLIARLLLCCSLKFFIPCGFSLLYCWKTVLGCLWQGKWKNTGYEKCGLWKNTSVAYLLAHARCLPTVLQGLWILHVSALGWVVLMLNRKL